MKYKDLIQFESVDEIIKFDKLDDDNYRDRLVKTFVCSNAFENFIIPRICRELDLDSTPVITAPLDANPGIVLSAETKNSSRERLISLEKHSCRSHKRIPPE